MIRLVVALVAASMMLGGAQAHAQVAAQVDAPTVPGPNKRFCTDWDAALSNGPAAPQDYLMDVNWMYGYLAGLTTTYWFTHKHVDLLNGADSTTIASWTDDYCARNPNSSMWAAGNILFSKLGGTMP